MPNPLVARPRMVAHGHSNLQIDFSGVTTKKVLPTHKAQIGGADAPGSTDFQPASGSWRRDLLASAHSRGNVRPS